MLHIHPPLRGCEDDHVVKAATLEDDHVVKAATLEEAKNLGFAPLRIVDDCCGIKLALHQQWR